MMANTENTNPSGRGASNLTTEAQGSKKTTFDSSSDDSDLASDYDTSDYDTQYELSSDEESSPRASKKSRLEYGPDGILKCSHPQCLQIAKETDILLEQVQGLQKNCSAADEESKGNASQRQGLGDNKLDKEQADTMQDQQRLAERVAKLEDLSEFMNAPEDPKPNTPMGHYRRAHLGYIKKIQELKNENTTMAEQVERLWRESTEHIKKIEVEEAKYEALLQQAEILKRDVIISRYNIEKFGEDGVTKGLLEELEERRRSLLLALKNQEKELNSISRKYANKQMDQGTSDK